MIHRARAEARKSDWQQRLRSAVPTPPPGVFVAPIAAGEKVVASAKCGIFKFLQSNYGDAVAVEMEGRGLLQAAHANQQVSALIIRGIANLIDAKSELDAARFQETAAHHASAFAFEILAKLEGLSNSACSSELEPQFKSEQCVNTNQGTYQGDTVAVSIQQPSSALQSISPTPNFPNFFGRSTELNELEQKIREFRVVLVYGTPGVGKTYVSAQIAKALSEEYKVLWLDKEELTLDELLFQINELLKANGEYGFITTYSQQKIDSQKKISTLIQVINNSKCSKYTIFIDNFQDTKLTKDNGLDLKPFIEQFSNYAQESRVVLLNRASASKPLGTSLAAKVQEYEMKGFKPQEATDYIKSRSEKSTIKWFADDDVIHKVIEKTDGHPMALNLIVQLCGKGASLKDILTHLVEYDSNFGAGELREKLLKNIAVHLNNEEKEALHRLSVFRVPVQSSVWECLNISQRIGQSLLQQAILTLVSPDRFQMHPLIREFWWEEAPDSQEEKLSWHEKAGRYYWELGKNSAKEKLDRSAYLEAYYHFNKTGQTNLAAQVVNELICYIYQKERLPSESLPGLTAWLLKLDDSVFDNKPWLLLEKGCKLEKNGKGKEAEDIFQKAYRAFELEKNKLGASIALYYVGKILHRKQPKLSLKYLDLVLKIAEESCPPDIPMQIRTLGKLISCYTDLGDYDFALDAATHAEQLALMSGDQLGRALILYRKGSSARNQSNFSKAEEFFSSSAEAFEKLGDIYRASKSYSRLGLVQERQGKFAQAINNLEKAIKIKRNINDEYGLALDLDYLGDVYRSQGLYRQAINRYEESLALKKKGNDVHGVVKAYNNLARVELTIGRLPEANDYLQKSEEGIKNLKENNERYIGLSGSRLIIQGDLKISQGNYNEALHSYQQAKVCFSSNPHSYARVLLSFGRTYLELRKIALAKKYLNNSLQIFEQQHTPYHEALALTYLARLAAITGRIEEANAQNQKAMSLAIENKLQPILTLYQETQGLIEETKIFKEFNFESIRILEKEEITETLIQRVEKHYDAAIQDESIKKEAWRQEEIPKEETLNVVRLRIKKVLWRLTVKHFIGEQFSSEQAHQWLQTADNNPDSSSLQKLFMLELLITKQTLHILHSISILVAKRIAEYALYVLCPLVLRFGFNTIRQEIESLAFRFLSPSDYQEITQLINSNFSNQKRFILLLKKELKKPLMQKNIQFDLQARAKTPYSIYRKKTERRVNLDEIIDLVGFRIITQTKDECYKALDVVKAMGKLYEGEGILAEPIRDYILRPKKSTGYQSIHINIMIEPDMEKFKEPESHVVEFQIRTQKMDLAAEVGDAAHSLYKSTANYARPSSKRDNELQQLQQVNLLIECDSGSVNMLGRIIRASKFDISNVDIGKKAENQTILLLELLVKSKKKAWKNTEYVNKAIEQLLNNLKIVNSSSVEIIKTNEHNLENHFFELSPQDKVVLLNELTKDYNVNRKFIYVLTPKGHLKKLEVLILKEGNKKIEIAPTPIDFAYQIHSEVGNQCYQAMINGKKVALNTRLKNWDIVEIIKNKNSHPSLEWLKQPKDIQKNHPFVTTKSARKKIIEWYKKSHREEMVIRGRELLEKELGKKAFEMLLKSGVMQAVAESLNYLAIEDLLAALGSGPFRLNLVVNDGVVEEAGETTKEEERKSNKEDNKKNEEETKNKKEEQKSDYGILKLSKVTNEIYKIKVQRGWDLLTKQITKKDVDKLISSSLIKALLERERCQTFEQLLIKLYENKAEVKRIVNILQQLLGEIHQQEQIQTYTTQSVMVSLTTAISSDVLPSKGSPISLRDISKICIHLAKCCNPVYYEESLGFIKSLSLIKRKGNKIFPESNGRGIFIHRPECHNLKNIPSERRCPVLWSVDVEIETVNRANMLSEITGYLGANGINISEGNFKPKPKPNQDKAVISLSIDVRNRQEYKQVHNLFTQISRMKDVLALRYVENSEGATTKGQK